MPSRKISIDLIVSVRSTQGYTNNCPLIGITFLSLELIAKIVAKLPPALSPPTAKRVESPLMMAELFTAQVVAAQQSSAGPGTSVPIKVNGRSASTRVTLMPAAKGKGLVIGETGKKVLELAGVTDVLSRTKGQTRTTINYAAATFNALKNLNTTRISNQQREKVFGF